MKKNRTVFTCLFLVILVSCASKQNIIITKAPQEPPPSSVLKPPTGPPKVKLEELVSTTDTICGMDLRDGMKDTILYKGKIYGFCIFGCKKEFYDKIVMGQKKAGYINQKDLLKKK